MPEEVKNMLEVHNYVHAEYLKAVQRVGETAEDAMKWILKFIDLQNPEYDLEQLDISQLEKVKFEICAIAEYGYQVGSFSEDFIIDTELSTKTSPSSTQAEPNIPTKKEVYLLQIDIRGSVDHLIDAPESVYLPMKGNPSVAYPLSHFLVIVARLSNPLRGKFCVSGKSTEMFMFKCYQLLAHFLPRLRHCRASDCVRLFLAEHGKKQYCSKQCQNRIGVRNFRKKVQLKKNKSSVQPKKDISHGTKKRKG